MACKPEEAEDIIKNELILEERPKVSTELARRMLQKNLERLLLTEQSKDVISELTGSMTPTQVQKLVEKTNSELLVQAAVNSRKPEQEQEQNQHHASIMKKNHRPDR